LLCGQYASFTDWAVQARMVYGTKQIEKRTKYANEV